MCTLLNDLTTAGFQLHRDGDRVQVIPPSGASLDPFRERIRQNKPALLQELLQAEIIAALDVAPEHFDCQQYDELWQRWHALEAKETKS